MRGLEAEIDNVVPAVRCVFAGFPYRSNFQGLVVVLPGSASMSRESQMLGVTGGEILRQRIGSWPPYILGNGGRAC